MKNTGFASFSVGLAAIFTASAHAQSAQNAVFTANNGNLEGGVTAFTFDSTGQPVFVQKLVIGSRPNSQTYDPGTNAYAIDISPSGRFLMVSHATSSETVEQLTLVEIAADATLTLRHTYTTPDSPLDLKWVDDRHVVVTRTDLGSTNHIILYQFDPDTLALTEIDRQPGGTFTAHVAVHPSGNVVYAGDSNSNWIQVFVLDADSRLELAQTVLTGSTYPLGLDVTPDGSKLYACGGISNGGHSFLGYHIGPDGLLSEMEGSPFFSSGQSPFNVSFHAGRPLLFLGHGSDATLRSFTYDPLSGVPSETGAVFDVGTQGSFGDSATIGDLLVVSDDFLTPTGIYAFTIGPDGELTPNGPMVDAQSVSPSELVAWRGVRDCVGDLDQDDHVALSDLTLLLGSFGACSGDPAYLPAADLDESGCVDLPDLAGLLANFGNACR